MNELKIIFQSLLPTHLFHTSSTEGITEVGYLAIPSNTGAVVDFGQGRSNITDNYYNFMELFLKTGARTAARAKCQRRQIKTAGGG